MNSDCLDIVRSAFVLLGVLLVILVVSATIIGIVGWTMECLNRAIGHR